MTITRHFIDVKNPDGSARRVHYRRAGSGPPVLLIHQSPRSSAEYVPMLERWSADFTCLAPDTPGFGESAPLPNAAPVVNDYADAVIAFMDALDLPRAGAYGFHSGAITLITAAKRQPQRFNAVAAEGYAVWTDAERADFAARYTPPYTLMPYGEHLTWTWHRLREQSWFFPWYAADDAHRLPFPHDSARANHNMAMDVLAAGPSYALGYAAVLQAPRDLPEPGAATPPCLLSGRGGDPLQAHIDRLGPLPPGWEAVKLETAADTEAASRAWLKARAEPAMVLPRPPDDEGYVPVAGFGQLHWLGDRACGHLHLHAPGSAAEFAARPGVLALDLPGHGLSDCFAEAPTLDQLADVLEAALEMLVTADLRAVTGDGITEVLAARLATRLGLEPAAAGNAPVPGFPDLAADRFGSHLTRAWGYARAEAAFAPWDAPSAENAIPVVPGALDPARLHRRTLAALRARFVPELIEGLKAAR